MYVSWVGAEGKELAGFSGASKGKPDVLEDTELPESDSLAKSIFCRFAPILFNTIPIVRFSGSGIDWPEDEDCQAN